MFDASTAQFEFLDNSKATFGSNDDLKIYHNGTDSIIDNSTDAFFIKSQASARTLTNAFIVNNFADNESIIDARADAAVSLYYNGSKKFETTSSGVSVTGNMVATGHVSIPDGQQIRVGSGDDLKILHSGGTNIINSVNGDLNFEHSNTAKVVLTGGAFRPATNGNIDLGTSSYRWQDIYTNDLNLSNEGSSNDVDGTWGNWTIQEGESDLFLKNNRSGKKYKFNLTEVS
jgi:hypothetical protein